MFTGIIEETGLIKSVKPTPSGIRLALSSTICARGTEPGESIAVNGVCLTVTDIKRSKARAQAELQFDLLRETWTRTNLQFAQPGGAVNLERAMAGNSRFGGHLVTGHIDGLGTIQEWAPVRSDWHLKVSAPRSILKYVIFKGSIAIDGISLTVAKVTHTAFEVWIIPHTFQATALRERKVKDKVNLEADLIGKYVEKFTSPWKPKR